MARIGRELNKPAILIPTDDLGAILIAEESATLRQWFVFPNISVGMPRTLANKGMLYTLCRQMGVPCPNTLVPTSLSDVNEFAETVRFPVVKTAAAWLDPKLRVSIARTERELVDAWLGIGPRARRLRIYWSRNAFPMERTGSSTATAMARRIAWRVSPR
jgi:hypothetical protein